MSHLIYNITLVNEIKKESFIVKLQEGIEFIKSNTSKRIAVCENSYTYCLVLKTEYKDYIEVFAEQLNVKHMAVIEFATGAEMLIPSNKNDTNKYISLTSSTLRKHDRERHDLSVLTEKPTLEAAHEIADLLENEGLFYE